VLLIGGPILRTPVLNWISGPAIVVASVVVMGMLRDRRHANDPGSGDPARHDPGTPPVSGGDR
jgi:hypothetical protein